MRLRVRGLTLLVLLVLVQPALSQEKRQQADRARTKPSVAVNNPTFETLICDDCYKFYGEARNIGSLIRSESANQVLEPIMKFAGPPVEFKTIVKFLTLHSEEVMTSRLLVATSPSAKNVPDVVVALDFPTAAEATKFSTPLNGFLNKVLPPTEETSESQNETGPTKPPTKTSKPSFYLSQYGPMLVLTTIKLSLPALRQTGKLLTENSQFRTAHNRFVAESLFFYIDFGAIEKEEEEQRKQYAEEAKKRQEELERNPQAEEPGEQAEEMPPVEIPETKAPESQETPKTAPAEVTISNTLQPLATAFFAGQGRYPDALGLGLSIEGESFDARALLINSSGVKTDAIPFLPMFAFAPGLVPEAPSILPADTELFISLSLDFPQIFTRMAALAPREYASIGGTKTNEAGTPFGSLEKQLNIKVKDDLLPLLGSEVALSLPIQTLDFIAPSQKRAKAQTAGSPETNASEPFVPGPLVMVALRDRERMKALLPKLVESMGFKGANAFAQTESKEDTEIVSYANAFAYALVGNFLVLSDPPTIRHVVDRYLNHETLAGETQFKNYTRWQPRQLQGQVYVSPALMASYRTWAQQPNAIISDQTREFLARLTMIAEPITYSLSNDGTGPFHEIHVPKNLVLMAVAAVAGEANPPPMLSNEKSTIGALYSVFSAEVTFRGNKGAGSFTSLDELVDQQLVNKEVLENFGYRIEVISSGVKFQATATPLEYGKTGKRSFFIDESGVVRGGDHGGGVATVSDDPIE